jgi:hypothetical protein
MVLLFVGFMGAYRDPSDLSPLGLGGLLATWVAFIHTFYEFHGRPIHRADAPEQGADRRFERNHRRR